MLTTFRALPLATEKSDRIRSCHKVAAAQYSISRHFFLGWRAILAQGSSMLEAAIAFWSITLLGFSFAISKRRRVMPRRGWVPALDGWVQIIRGPRPPAERWPKIVRAASAGAPKPWQQIQEQAPVGRWRQSEKPRSTAIAAA